MKLGRFIAAAGYVLALTGAAAAIAAGNTVISQKDKTFSEKKISIAAGDNVTFLNDDDVGHNILVKEMDFNGGVAEPGTETVVTFADSGKFKVRCGIHPKMKLTVEVN